MKKYWKTGMIVCAAVLVAAVLYAVSGIWTASASYANAEKYTAGGANISGEVSCLDVDWTNGKVHIAYYAGTEIELSESCKEALSEDRQMRWWLDGSTLRIKYEKPGIRWFGWRAEKELTIRLPEGLHLDEAVIGSTSGDIDAASLDTDRLTVKVTSGDVHLATSSEQLAVSATSGDLHVQSMQNAQSIRMETTSGAIWLEALDVTQLKTSSTSGKIHITAGTVAAYDSGCTSGDVDVTVAKAGEAKISTTSGRIQARVGEAEKLEFGSTSGDITAYLREKPGFTAMLETTSGDIGYELPLSRQGAQYTCGDGSGQIHIHATSGNIRILSLQD